MGIETAMTNFRPYFSAVDGDVDSSAGTQIYTAERRALSDVRPWRADRDPIRVIAEIYVPHGGANTRALLGASFTRADGVTTTIRLFAEEDPITVDRVHEAPSSLGPPLLRGLPSDLARFALEGLVGSGEPALPAGVLDVDRAAHDVADSNQRSLRLVAAFLVDALAARLRGEDVSQVVADHTAALRTRSR